MLSRGLKITAWTGAVCAEMRDSGPRWGVDVEVESFRRLDVRADGRRVVGAAGADDSTVVQRPILSSAPADRIRCDVP